ncbi:MAG: cysteine hydrolase [Candidatus Aureabacteria bacterium]|nr:cysteine hydrolase [Candidatus Auribacterota bacterium]
MPKRIKSTNALLVIDMLDDFVLKGSPLEVPRARRIISNIKKRIARATREQVPIIYVCDKHRKDDPEFNVWPKHAVNGAPGSEIISELKPRSRDYIVDKTTYSAFYRSKLEKLLKKLGTRKIVLTGVVTEICILYTAVDALMRGFQVEVPEDCVAGLQENDHRFALRQINKMLKPFQG